MPNLTWIDYDLKEQLQDYKYYLLSYYNKENRAHGMTVGEWDSGRFIFCESIRKINKMITHYMDLMPPLPPENAKYIPDTIMNWRNMDNCMPEHPGKYLIAYLFFDNDDGYGANTIYPPKYIMEIEEYYGVKFKRLPIGSQYSQCHWTELPDPPSLVQIYNVDRGIPEDKMINETEISYEGEVDNPEGEEHYTVTNYIPPSNKANHPAIIQLAREIASADRRIVEIEANARFVAVNLMGKISFLERELLELKIKADK